MVKYYKVIHPIQRDGKIIMPGKTIHMDEEKAKYIMQNLEPVEIKENPPEPKAEKQEPVAVQVATPVKEEKKKNGGKK